MTDAPEAAPNPIVRLLIEAGPIVAFFVANLKFGIFKATAVFMGAVVLSLAASWITERRIPPMPLVTAVFVLIFGGLTLYFEDDTFIKLKPTIVNVLFASTLFGGLVAGKSLLKPLMGAALQMSDDGWRILTFRWAIFFLILAVLNELVWRNWSTEAWISFKLWALIPLTFVFMMTQMGLIQRYSLETEEPEAS